MSLLNLIWNPRNKKRCAQSACIIILLGYYGQAIVWRWTFIYLL